MATDVNPTVRRRRLGLELRRLRERKGLTAEDVAARLLVSQSKISRLENGRRSISPRDVRDLCQIYSVGDERVIDSLMKMAKESRQRGWWHAFGDVPYSVYIGLEADAASVRNYESLVVPGLLQTQEYAEAVVRGIQPESPLDVVEQRVNVRMTRQERIHATQEPMRFWAVVDEAALRRPVGGEKVMHDQLLTLIEVSRLPHVTVQIMPFGNGAHPGMTGAFSIMSFPESSDSDVVYLEGVTSDLYVERMPDVHRYTVMYEHLTAASLGPTETRVLIADVAKEYAA